MNIAIAADHAANDLKQALVAHLQQRGFPVTDLSDTYKMTAHQPIEYPDHAVAVGRAVTEGPYTHGVLLCGTGAGVCMTAGKLRGVRAVVCSEPYTARLARGHNNANVLCLGARVVGSELAKDILDAFLDTSFEGGRHATRVDKIMAVEPL